jgi:hypothetical protein
MSLLDSWAAAYYAVQPIGSFFARSVHLASAILLPLICVCSLTRLMFLSHLARFTLRVRALSSPAALTRPAAAHTTAAAIASVIVLYSGCCHIPLPGCHHCRSCRQRMDCQRLL